MKAPPTKEKVRDVKRAMSAAFKALCNPNLPKGVGSKCWEMLSTAMMDDTVMVQEITKSMPRYDKRKRYELRKKKGN